MTYADFAMWACPVLYVVGYLLAFVAMLEKNTDDVPEKALCAIAYPLFVVGGAIITIFKAIKK